MELFYAVLQCPNSMHITQLEVHVSHRHPLLPSPHPSSFSPAPPPSPRSNAPPQVRALDIRCPDGGPTMAWRPGGWTRPGATKEAAG